LEKSRSYLVKIDSAFSFLLMSRNLLETTIAESDSERAIELACLLVAQLVKSAIDDLSPAKHSFLSPAERFRPRTDNGGADNQGLSIHKPPLVDVDERVSARLRELLAI